MKIIEEIREKAASLKKTIVLPRSSDERVIKAAEFLSKENICRVVLIKNEKAPEVNKEIEIIDSTSNKKLEKYAASFFEKRKHKGITQEQAMTIVQDPLFYSASMVSEGDADGCVAGSVSTTGDVLRAAIQTIGLKPGSNVVSSIFLMSFEDGRAFSYGDCAVVPYPTAEQLAIIAVDSAASHKALTAEEPKVAMLSFSTRGSARHERVDLVEEALELAKKQDPLLKIDGTLQFDAAMIDSIGKRKAPGSEVAGNANVFIFPNLDAGNIGYKITERLAGATATGPVIQGLVKPMMDLSRGCSWEDIVNTSCVAALLA
ncbi:MAG: phosphate acetyltransferase [Balneolaceae bacterium]|nr:phosphate acetyltransferase [Balneolaceae bacterium]MBO6546231.1 phosphate acetyltransferase [Balneolaceae bacterium]MBO6648590.1 phosphate acetyltransferase [Balneolaceae bacterium]